MSLWCLACSPLMIGCDVRNMDAETAGPLTNRAVLAVNQDALGIPGRRVKQAGRGEVWKKPLADGSLAVGLLNRDSVGRDLHVTAKDLGLLGAPKRVHDLWAGQDRDAFAWGMTHRVEPHQTLLFKVTSGQVGAGGWYSQALSFSPPSRATFAGLAGLYH